MRLFLLYEGVFSRKYVRGRLQVRAGTVASTCGEDAVCLVLRKGWNNYSA